MAQGLNIYASFYSYMMKTSVELSIASRPKDKTLGPKSIGEEYNRILTKVLLLRHEMLGASMEDTTCWVLYRMGRPFSLLYKCFLFYFLGVVEKFPYTIYS